MKKLVKYDITFEIKEDYISVLEDVLKCLRWINRQHNVGFNPIRFKKLNQ